MADLFDYVTWRGDLTFEQAPLNELDALSFSQIAYVLLDGVVSTKFDETKTLRQLAEDFNNLPDFEKRKNIGFLINDRTTDFMLACANSERFGNIEVCGFRNIFNEERVEQFAALTFIIDKDVVIAYRGTDDTILGFEEDFRIAYMDEIPAQKDAIDYFSDAKDAFPHSHFIILGHSKGGNLAVNTAVKCDKKLRKRIKAVYNFDGPGFKKEFFETEDFKEIEDILYSFYPSFSVVGMLFHHPKKYKIIESTKFAIMQHDAMCWNVSGKELVEKDDFTDECKLFTSAFNNWVDAITKEEKEDFVNCLFSLIKSSGYKTNLEIEKNPLQASARIIAAYAKMAKEKKDQFKDIFMLFVNAVKSELPVFRIGLPL